MTTYQPELSREIEAARALIYAYRAELEGDEQATLDAVEGETNLQEAMQEAIQQTLELEAHMAAIAELIGAMQARKSRMDDKRDRIRQRLLTAMEVLGTRKITFPIATIGVRATPESVDIIDASRIPPKYQVPQPPKPDKRGILAAIKHGEHIDGVKLIPSRNTIAIKAT